MANTDSANFSPTFKMASADTDTFDSSLQDVLPAALDTHDHTSNKGVAIGRIASGVAASRPAAGHAGAAYWATDTFQFSLDTGSAWVSLPGMQWLQTVTATAGVTTTLTFNPISGVYSSLRLIVIARNNSGTTNGLLNLRFNNDSGANYDYTTFGSLATGQTAIPLGYMPDAAQTAGWSASYVVEIPMYAQTTLHKHALWKSDGYLSTYGDYSAGAIWHSTTAISRLDLYLSAPADLTFAAGTVAMLYGIV